MNNDLAQTAIGAALSSDWLLASKVNLEILKSDPVNLDTLNRLGRAYTELGDIKQAILTYKQVLKIDKYNQIAEKNLARLTNVDKRKKNIASVHHAPTTYDFVEEPGKTRIITLVNIASPKTISGIRPATNIGLKPKRHTVQVYLNDHRNTYLGSLPDDLGHRLETLIRAGNTYEAYIKSTGKSFVTVFIKEVARCKKFKNIPSFVPYSADHQPHPEGGEEVAVDPAKKTPKAGEDNEEEDDVFTQKITQLHMDEEPET